jgi:hypothetical protein
VSQSQICKPIDKQQAEAIGDPEQNGETDAELLHDSLALRQVFAALVLGLLISNANTKFTQLGGEVTALSAEILRLDHILRRYGAEAEPARKILLQYAEQKAADLFPADPADAASAIH